MRYSALNTTTGSSEVPWLLSCIMTGEFASVALIYRNMVLLLLPQKSSNVQAELLN
jgi:hypothetical protein